MDILTLIILVIVGFLLGIIGAIMGSTLLIITPLLHFFGLPIHSAIATGKVSILSRELIPAIDYGKHKLVSFKLTIPFVISGVIFSYIGTQTLLTLEEKTVKIIVAGVMVLISVVLFFEKSIGLKEKKIKYSPKIVVISIILGGVIGFYQGIFGGGTNPLIIFSFVMLFGNTFLKAVANSKIPNFIFALVSSIIFIVKGYVNWSFAIPLLISTAIGSYFGAELAIKKGNKFIRGLFVGLVVVMAVKLLFFG